MRHLRHTPNAAILALLICLTACPGEDAAGPSALEGEHRGTMAGGDPNISAAFDFAIAATAATGTLRVVGAAPVALTGNWVVATGVVTLAGGGFTITGTIDATGKLAGVFSSATSSGFAAGFQHSSANPVSVFCGTYAGDADGVWNLVRRGSSLSGAYVNVDGSDGYLNGSMNGTTVSITDITDSPGGTATGTLAGTTMSGTWTGQGFSGTWTSSASC